MFQQKLHIPWIGLRVNDIFMNFYQFFQTDNFISDGLNMFILAESASLVQW